MYFKIRMLCLLLLTIHYEARVGQLINISWAKPIATYYVILSIMNTSNNGITSVRNKGGGGGVRGD